MSIILSILSIMVPRYCLECLAPTLMILSVLLLCGCGGLCHQGGAQGMENIDKMRTNPAMEVIIL